MNYLPKIFQHNMLSVIIFLLPSAVFAFDNIPIASTVIFNTSCARCHEGQCSGRMTFQLPEKAANQHILRHGGTLTEEQLRHLYKLLRYMKEECSFYPLTIALINDQIWERDMLNKFQSPSKDAYFMPLGLLEPGIYELLFEEPGNIKFCVDIISDEFDFIDKDILYDDGGKMRLKFNAEEHSKYFLRLTAQTPISLKKLTIITKSASEVKN